MSIEKAFVVWEMRRFREDSQTLKSHAHSGVRTRDTSRTVGWRFLNHSAIRAIYALNRVCLNALCTKINYPYCNYWTIRAWCYSITLLVTKIETHENLQLLLLRLSLNLLKGSLFNHQKSLSFSYLTWHF